MAQYRAEMRIALRGMGEAEAEAEPALLSLAAD
jgi:hypothetical protein